MFVLTAVLLSVAQVTAVCVSVTVRHVFSWDDATSGAPQSIVSDDSRAVRARLPLRIPSEPVPERLRSCIPLHNGCRLRHTRCVFLRGPAAHWSLCSLPAATDTGKNAMKLTQLGRSVRVTRVMLPRLPNRLWSQAIHVDDQLKPSWTSITLETTSRPSMPSTVYTPEWSHKLHIL